MNAHRAARAQPAAMGYMTPTALGLLAFLGLQNCTTVLLMRSQRSAWARRARMTAKRMIKNSKILK